MRIVEAFTVRLPERHSQDKKVQLENGKKTLGGERERKKKCLKVSPVPYYFFRHAF